jgi:cyclophilin family peptidyl-prolyl cis-trans isomerase
MKSFFSLWFLFGLLLANIHCASSIKTSGAPYTGADIDRFCSNPDRLLVIETNEGIMKIQLFDKIAPNHVAQITKLAASGQYDGTTFHRVKAEFIQGGDPNSKKENSPDVGTGGMGNKLDAEFSSIGFRRGVCGMALGSSENSAQSQFFICAEDKRGFDHRYTVWGQVVEGYATLDSIASLAGSKKYPKASDGSVNPGKDAEMIKVYMEERK